MGVLVKRFPEFGVSLTIWRGAMTPEIMSRHIETLQPLDAALWIHYLDPTLDLSGLDVAHIPSLKRAQAAKLREIHGEAPVVSALVSAAPVNDLVLRFWPSYVGLDDDYPVEPVAFPTLHAACDWLGLDRGAAETLARAVEAEDARMPD